MSSSDGLRAILNRRRQPQEQNEKIDRRDFQNMGGMVEDHRRRSCRIKLNSNVVKSHGESNILPKKTRIEKPQGKKEKIDRKDTPPSEQLFLKNVASSAILALVKPTGDNLDMAWEWNSLKDISNKRAVTCDFCLKTTNGGITRAKRHQIGFKGDVSSCKKIPPSIKLKIKKAYEKKKAVKFGLEKENDDEEEEAATEEINIRAVKSCAKRRSIMKGSMNMNTLKILELSNKLTLGMAKRKTSIRDSACIKKARAKANQCIAQFIHENEIPFKVARSKGFKMMIEAVGDYGQQLNPHTQEMNKPHDDLIEQTQHGEAIEDEQVVEPPLRLTCGVVGNAIEVGEPSRLTRQHTELTIAAPIEEEKEEEEDKHEENPKPKPEITKKYARKRRRVNVNALAQV